MQALSNLFAVFLLAISFNCVVIPSDPFGDTRGDSAAANVQKMMQSAVYTEIGYTLNTALADGGISAEEMGSYGSGIVVGRCGNDTVVLTVAHICETPAEITDIKIIDSDHSIGSGVIIFQDNDRDVCLLRISSSIGARSAVMSRYDPVIGSEVFTTGFPGGRRWDSGISFFTGNVYSVKERQPDVNIPKAYITSIPVMVGLSGSGVFYKNELVGMVRAVMTNFHHTSYIIPVSEFRIPVENALECK